MGTGDGDTWRAGAVPRALPVAGGGGCLCFWGENGAQRSATALPSDGSEGVVGPSDRSSGSGDHLDRTGCHVQATLDPPQLKHQQKRGPAVLVLHWRYAPEARLARRLSQRHKVVMPFACAA